MISAVTVGLGGPGGDGAAEEGAHRGSEGDQEAAGETSPQSSPLKVKTHLLRRSTENTYILSTCMCASC